MMSVSPLEELSSGQFQPIIPTSEAARQQRQPRLVLCSGKVYYDLLEARREQGLDDVAIVRIEQLYPFPVRRDRAQIDKLSERHRTSSGARKNRATRARGTRSATGADCRSATHQQLGLRRPRERRGAGVRLRQRSRHEQQQAKLVESALGGPRRPR